MSDKTGLDAWFVHEKLVLNLLPPTKAAALTQELGRRSWRGSEAAARANVLERAVVDYMTTHEVHSLDVQFLRGVLQPGQLVWFEHAIAFKGLREALENIGATGEGRATFSARLASDPSIQVHGDYNAARLTCSTARSELSGTRRQFLLGYVQDIGTGTIQIRSIMIAFRWFSPLPEISDWEPVDPVYLWPGAVDQLADVDFSKRLHKADLNVLKDVPEADVKRAFAEILGEPEVPKDWGGEQFDLWTTHLFVEGQPLQAALLFKGPAEFKPMTIASLGKNGDQIDRIAQTAADVLVVQHCHAVTAPVVNMLRAYASDFRRPRRYLVIDGYDTVKILRHFGYL